MNTLESRLSEVRPLFTQKRLHECYAILKRFFDRVPFQLNPEHGEYIGIFIRTLLELGKEKELGFYIKVLEERAGLMEYPWAAYVLATAYFYSGDSKNLQTAKVLFEKVIGHPESGEFGAKARMMLADYYFDGADWSTCKILIHDIKTTDPSLQRLVNIWKALLARKEKRFEDALEILKNILKGTPAEHDWYAYFSAELNLALLYIDMGKRSLAEGAVRRIKKMFGDRVLKSVRFQLAVLVESKLLSADSPLLTLKKKTKSVTLSSSRRSLELQPDNHADRLLRLLCEKGHFDKGTAISVLYERAYQSSSDDKLIYRHVHSVRKKLESLGLAQTILRHDTLGYHLVAKVQIQ